MDSVESNTAARTMKKITRLEGHRICFFGCEVNIEALTPEPINLIEDHHVHGKKNDPETIVGVCLNHHAMLHEGFLRACVSMKFEPYPHKHAAIIEETEAVLFEQIAAVRHKKVEKLLKNDPLSIFLCRIMVIVFCLAIGMPPPPGQSNFHIAIAIEYRAFQFEVLAKDNWRYAERFRGGSK